MNAFLLSLLAFYLLTLVGYLSIPRKVIEQNKHFALFLSPALGLSICVLLAFSVSRLGLEMKYFGYPFVALALALAIYQYTQKNLHLPDKILLGKFLLAPVGILISSWPILKYGFNWISYVNDDMNNYVLAAKNFYNSSFFSEPNRSLDNGTDYSQLLHYFYVQGGVRPGSELFLAGYSNFNQGDTLSIFMPAILTLQLILLFSTLALVQISFRFGKSGTQITYILFLFSPLIALGYLYQLIAQVGGLAIGVAILALVTFLVRDLDLKIHLPSLLILSIFTSAMLIWYPELTPFLVIPMIIYLSINRRNRLSKIAITTILVIAFQVLFLNNYFLNALKFLITQFAGQESRSTGDESVTPLFPYFLKPHGIPSLFGFTPINKALIEPWESIAIVLSIFLIILVMACSILTYKETPLISSSFIIMTIAFVYFVVSQNGFASFKLSMFVQPILIIVLLTIFYKFNLATFGTKWSIVYKTSFLTYLVIQLITLQFYTSASTGDSTKGFAEINRASSEKIIDELRETFSTYKINDGTVISTSLNLSQSKLEAITSQGSPIVFPTSDIFENFKKYGFEAKGNIQRREVTFASLSYRNDFSQLATLGNEVERSHTYLVSSHVTNVINSSKENGLSKAWRFNLVKDPENYLLFVDSKMGPSYYSWTSTREKAVIFGAEKNPMVPGSFMRGIGNHLLFEVVNPSKNPILVLEISATLLPQYSRKLPQIGVTGQGLVTTKPEGSGSARLLITIEDLVKINNRLYFQLDLDRRLKPMPESSSGISQIFGSKVRSDSRILSVFTSNISVIDSSEVSQMQRPSKLRSFPLDLQNSTLEYSGIYEDGWISRLSSFKLSSKKASVLNFKGSIPDLGDGKKFSTNLKIFMGTNLLFDKALGYGEFDLELPVKNLQGNGDFENVRISFSRDQILPKPDGRPAAAYVSLLGFN